MSDNPLFAGFMPVPIVKENPFTGETSQEPAPTEGKPPKPPRKKRAAKAEKPPKGPKVAKPKRPYRKREPKLPPDPVPVMAKHAALAPGQTLQSVFLAMKGLDEADYPVFEKLLGDREMRARVLGALKQLSLA